MSQHMNSALIPPVLTLTQPAPALIEVFVSSSATSAPTNRTPDVSYEPAWSLIIERMVQVAFAGRDVCFIIPEPRLEWADLELATVAPRITTLQRANLVYTLAFAREVSRQVVAEVARSQDFRHGGLLIAATAEDSELEITHFLDVLAQAGTVFPAWDEWIHLPAQEISSILQAHTAAKLRSTIEFMECLADGERIAWYHAQPELLADCLDALHGAAVEQGWHVATHLR